MAAAHLLRGVDGGQGLGAALVVAVLAGDLRVVLSPLLHEHLVNAPAQGGNGHSREQAFKHLNGCLLWYKMQTFTTDYNSPGLG